MAIGCLFEVIDAGRGACRGKRDAALRVDVEIAVSAHLIAAIGEAEGNHAHGVLRADAADQSISGLVLVIGELLAGLNCWCLGVEHEADGSRAGGITGHIGLTHGDGVAALDRGEG